MSACHVCTARTDGANLCRKHARTLERALSEMPWLIEQLEVTITRQDTGTDAPLYAASQERMDRGYEEGTITLPCTPWPFAWDAADMQWSIDNTLSTWLRHLIESRGLAVGALALDSFERAAGRGLNGTPAGRSFVGLPDLADHVHLGEAVIGYVYDGVRRTPIRQCPVCGKTAPARPALPDAAMLARIMLALLDTITQDEAAGVIYDEILSCERGARRAIDRQGPDVFLGRCDAIVLDVSGAVDIIATAEECGADLMAHTGDDEVRCRSCGAVFDVMLLKRRLPELDDAWARPHVIAGALSTIDAELSPSTLRTWIERDAKLEARLAGRPAPFPLILQVGIDDDGKPVYRVGDVRARVAFNVAAREKVMM